MAKAKPPGPAVTVQEAARQLGTVPRYVRKLLDEGKITEAPAVGRQRMCEAASVAQYEIEKVEPKKLTVAGVTKTLAQWSREKGIPWHVLTWRVGAGWTPAEAVNTPIRQTSRSG